MKRAFTLFLILFLSISPLCIEVDGKISPELLKEDVNFLVKSIEEIHPNPYAYTSKERFYELKANVLDQITRPMDRFEFFKLVAPLVASLGDGHTGIIPPGEPEKVFPIPVTIFDNNRVFVSMGYKDFTRGSEILSINGQDVKDLVEQMRKYISYERSPFAIAVLERVFPFYLYLELGECEEFEVRIRDLEGKERRASVKSNEDYNLFNYVYPFRFGNYSNEVLQAYARRYNELSSMGSVDMLYPYSYIPLNSDTSILIFNSCYDSFYCPFSIFLNGIFKSMNENGTKNLIIDLRTNVL